MKIEMGQKLQGIQGKSGTWETESVCKKQISVFLACIFNTLVHVWIVNLLAQGEERAAAPELSILLEGLPGCVRGSSSEGHSTASLSPAIHPDQWLDLWWTNSPNWLRGKGNKGEREAFSLTNINMRSKRFGFYMSQILMCQLCGALVHVTNCKSMLRH